MTVRIQPHTKDNARQVKERKKLRKREEMEILKRCTRKYFTSRRLGLKTEGFISREGQ